MPIIRAWQHIYTNVERDQSPSKTSGFQTLFYSKEGLSSDDLNDIEERVFYVYGNPNPVKRVFFPLKSNKVGISQILPLAGRDAAGREGLYLAHSLIFSRGDFLAAQVNPMDFFNSVSFVTSIAEAFAKGEVDTGNINSISCEVPVPSLPQTQWNPEEFRRLTQLAINFARLKEERSALAMVGSMAAIEETCHAVLSLLPAPISAQCSFDTFFERGGNLSFTYYWAAGFNAKPQQPFYVIVDVDEKTISQPHEFATPITSFGKWMDAQLEIGDMDFILQNKNQALLIGEFLDHKDIAVDSITTLESHLIQSVLDANTARVKAGIRNHITTAIPAQLADKIFTPIYETLSSEELIRVYANGFEVSQLLSQLFTMYKSQSFRPPGKEERQKLAEVLEQHKHTALQWLSLIWGGASWENPVAKWRIRNGLEEMNDEAFEGFWDLAVPAELVDPLELLVDGKEAIFAKLITRDAILPFEEVPALIKTLLKTENIASLHLLAPYLKHLSKKELKKVRRRIKNLEGIPEMFEQTLTLLES